MNTINDPEFRKFAEIAKKRSKCHKTGLEAWEKSPFAWLRKLQSRTRGKAFEELVSDWCKSHNFCVCKSPDSEADLVIDGVRVEVKGSTLWKSGIYKFQQIRDQDYDILICLGISPSDVHIWVIPKEIVMTWWKENKIRSQHGGRSGNDTAWLHVNPGQIHEWLQPFGGTLSEGLESLRENLI